jgi:hypothetical protein
VLTFALGVAGNIAIFSFVSGIVLGELPFPESRRIVVVYPSQIRNPESVGFISLREFELWRDQTRSLESLALFQRVASAAPTGSREPERVQRMQVTPEFFRVLRSAPAWDAGRIRQKLPPQRTMSPCSLRGCGGDASAPILGCLEREFA